jgi:hypothetical protein
MLTVDNIQRVTALTRGEFRDQYLRKNKPVILTELMESWPARGKWSLDFFKEKYGHIKVPVYSSKSSQAGKHYLSAEKYMSFKEYIETIEKGPTDIRLFLFKMFEKIPELKLDYRVPDVMEGFYKEYPYTFFGGQGSKVPMHYDIDMSHVFLSQFEGNKRVVLFSPEQSKKLYHQPFTVASYIDVDNPDFNTFPALKRAHGYECILKPGETLFIPSGYWHYITYLDAGFSMSQRASDSMTSKLKGALNIATHYLVDRSMNRLLGQKWRDMKERMAIKRANAEVIGFQD